MDIWIRSQDKTKLVKVNYVYMMESNDHFTIYGETIDSGPIVGTYATKERALEILDGIEDYMKKCVFAKKVNGLGEELDLIPNPIVIYTMPEE